MRAVDPFEEKVGVSCIARKLRASEKSVYQWRRTWMTGRREAPHSRGPSAKTAGSAPPTCRSSSRHG
ncbi:helix-turn-helix domain-containing protein [Streptomyces sp. NPDC051554]|uniref:helix-turn-helix domain-containing protein n=1 Tax=Streptomyces sp. NPDC051554 TaxID=3365656 RepID=UPI003794A1A5